MNKNKRYNLFMLVVVILLMSYFSSAITSANIPMTYNGWKYYKPVYVTNPVNDGLLFLNVTYTSNMNQDFSDLRFTDSDGTPLNYYIYYTSPGQYALVVVRLPESFDATYDYIFTEDFEDTCPPTGWTIIDGNTNGYTWECNTTLPSWSSGNSYGVNGTFMLMDDSVAGENVNNTEELLTSSIDLSGVDSAVLTFDGYFNHDVSNDYFSVDISTDGGFMFTTIYKVTDDTNFSAIEPIDLSSYAGQSDVIIRFIYSDGNNLGKGAFIDNVKVFNSNTKILMFYGNPTASSASSGENTFWFFDDFSDNSSWTIVGDATSSGYGYRYLYTEINTTNMNYNFQVITPIGVVDDSAYSTAKYKVGIAPTDNSGIYLQSITYYLVKNGTQFDYFLQSTTDKKLRAYGFTVDDSTATSSDCYLTDLIYENNFSTPNLTGGTWHLSKISISNTREAHFKYTYMNNTIIKSFNTGIGKHPNKNTNYIYIVLDGYDGSSINTHHYDINFVNGVLRTTIYEDSGSDKLDLIFDWIGVGKYVDPEPTATFGSESLVLLDNTIWSFQFLIEAFVALSLLNIVLKRIKSW